MAVDMRPLVLTAGLVLLLGCVNGDFELGPCFPLGAPCVSSKHPFMFVDGIPTQIALGGEATGDYFAFDSNFDLVSNDPSVLTVEQRGRDSFVMHAVGAGSTTIAARALDGSTLDTLGIRVAKIASVAFAFSPAGDQAQPKLAALPGARERIRVLPRDSGGRDLVGADRLLDFSFTGDLGRIEPATAKSRIGLFRFGLPKSPGYDIGVRFGALGGGSITATLDGAELGSLPIDVIAAASDIALRVDNMVQTDNPTVTEYVVVVGLVGNDANGVPVAGLVGDFTAAPPDLVMLGSANGAGEVLVTTLSTPGTVTISATLADRVLSRTITIQQRPK
jgi:hypothetical protein